MNDDKKRWVGKFLGVPYDWRLPTIKLIKSRLWNPEAPFITPKIFGWGYSFNFYSIIRPLKWRKARLEKANKNTDY